MVHHERYMIDFHNAGYWDVLCDSANPERCRQLFSSWGPRESPSMRTCYHKSVRSRHKVKAVRDSTFIALRLSLYGRWYCSISFAWWSKYLCNFLQVDPLWRECWNVWIACQLKECWQRNVGYGMLPWTYYHVVGSKLPLFQWWWKFLTQTSHLPYPFLHTT